MSLSSKFFDYWRSLNLLLLLMSFILKIRTYRQQILFSILWYPLNKAKAIDIYINLNIRREIIQYIIVIFLLYHNSWWYIFVYDLSSVLGCVMLNTPARLNTVATRLGPILSNGSRRGSGPVFRNPSNLNLHTTNSLDRLLPIHLRIFVIYLTTFECTRNANIYLQLHYLIGTSRSIFEASQ